MEEFKDLWLHAEHLRKAFDPMNSDTWGPLQWRINWDISHSDTIFKIHFDTSQDLYMLQNANPLML